MKEVRPHERKQTDYRILILRKMCKNFKLCKSFLQQKLATKLKHFGGLLKSDPNNPKFQKYLSKFERKMKDVKSMNSQSIKAAAFVFCRFDLKLNFDQIGKDVSAIIDQEVDGLVEEVFKQLGNDGNEESLSNYLNFYKRIKKKSPKKFSEAKDEALRLIEKVRAKKDSRKLRKKTQLQNKLSRRQEGQADRGEEGSDLVEDGGSSCQEEEPELQSPGKEAGEGKKRDKSKQRGADKAQQANDAQKEQLIEDIDKIIKTSTFFPRNRPNKERPKKEVKAVPEAKEFPHKNDRLKRAEARRIKKGNSKKREPERTDLHPSYQSKLATRLEQSNKRFEGEVFDLS